MVDRIDGLLDASDKELELLLILSGNQVVLAQVFVASTSGVALIEAENFINASLCSLLKCNHLPRSRRKLLAIGWVLQLSIPFVAGAFA